jgi:hypothetical protein
MNEELRYVRSFMAKRWVNVDKREADDQQGDLVLWFVNNDPAVQPNRKALELHKTACLIWRMAGGAEPVDEESSDDKENDPICVVDKRISLQEKISFLFSRESPETTLADKETLGDQIVSKGA